MSRRGFLAGARSLVSSPVYATVTTVLAVLAGLLGSVYQNDIAIAFPIAWPGPWGAVSIRASIFWASVLLFALMFFFRQWWDDHTRERLADTALRAEKGTERVEALVRTMPPRAFQGQLAQTVVNTYRTVTTVLPRTADTGLAREHLVSVIRVLLNSIARLAMVYDDQPLTADGSATYSANVMLFIERPPAGAFPSDVTSALRFHPPEYDVNQLRGVLVLRQDLSATSDVADLPSPDSAVPAIALPVPSELMRDGRWNALPGAPKAFLTEQVDGYDDAATLADWCATNGNFLPSVIRAIHDYFTIGDGRHIRSFISRPLLTSDGRPLGVLNLHSSRTDILGDADERMPPFLAMMMPLHLELVSALEALSRLEHSAPAPVAEGH